MTDFVITQEPPDSEAARSLIAQLDAELNERYPHEAIHGLHAEDFTAARLSFFVGRIAGRPVACGAIRLLQPGLAEVKRMFVLPAHRGQGLAKRILQTLEKAAGRLGGSVMRLETGSRQPEALGLYRAAGYRDIAAYGEYIGNPFSVCLQKRLA